MATSVKNRAPFVRVELVNASVKINPTDVLSFQMEKVNGEAYNQFSMVVQEKNRYSIARAIGELEKLEVKIQYGDTISDSKPYFGFILSFQSEIRGQNLYLTIHGYVSTTQTSVDRFSKNWSNYPEYHNNPSEIVKAIADKNGWVVDEIVETIPLRKLQDSAVQYQTQSSEEWNGIKIVDADFQISRTIEQSNQSDVQFIHDTLEPISIARDSFLLNFALTMTSSGGKTHISYKPLNNNKKSKKNYCFVYNNPEGTFGEKEVISFNSGLNEVFNSTAKANSSSNIQEAMADKLGSQSLDKTGMEEAYNTMMYARDTYMDVIKKNAYDNKVKDEERAQYIQQQQDILKAAVNTYNQAADAFFSIYYNKKIVEANAKNETNLQSDNITKYMDQIKQFGMDTYRYTATLQTLGNQSVSPGDSIDILVMLRNGSESNFPNRTYPHYTSGTYLITKQVDKIELGKYTTEFTLVKNTQKKIGSIEQLEALNLTLSDVFHTSYDSESIPSRNESNESAPFGYNTDSTGANKGTYRLTCYYPGDDCKSGTTTGTGKSIRDFSIATVNGHKCYTYNGKIVCAAATHELINSGYKGYNSHGGLRDTYLFRYYDEIELKIGGKVYDGIILDSCGASTWANWNGPIVDIFVPPPSQGGGQGIASSAEVYLKGQGGGFR